MFPMIFRAPPVLPGDSAGGVAMELFVQATPDEVALPEGFNPAEADFVRAGPDLMLTSPDGTQVLVADFFMMETPPALISGDGAHVAGDLAMRLSGSPTPGQVAGEIPEPSEIIGRVTDMNGEVTVIRADGSRMTLQSGDSVFQGDILETGLESGIGVLLADGTSLAMGDGARMVLDEMVYDPGTQDGSIALSVMKGIFTIVSGEISKIGPDAMMIHTPVATIGIRGTQIGLDLTNGKDLTLVMMEEADGFVGEVVVINDGGAMTVNQAYFAVTVSSYSVPPVAAPVYAIDDIVSSFGGALTYLPTLETNANDYGQQSDLGENVRALETDGGDLEVSEGGLAMFESAGEGEAAFETSAGDAAIVEDELEMPKIGVGEDVDLEPQPVEGLAGFETVAVEEPVATPVEKDFIVSAGPELSADELLSESDVIFGEEIEPIKPVEPVNATEPEEAVSPQATPAGPVAEDVIEPVVPSEAEPEPINAAPVAEPGTAFLAEDNTFTGQLAASDPEDGTLSFSLADDGAPANGSVTINADGSFSYVPDTDFGGTDSFTYMVTDDAGATSLATVSVTVTPVNDVPQIAAADATGYEDGTIALTLAATMPAGTNESISSITLSGVPDGAVLNAGTDNGDGSWTLAPSDLTDLTLTPPRDFNGSVDLSVSAVSTDGGAASSSFGLHVSSVADVPQLAVADAMGVEDGVVALTIAAAMPTGTQETVDSILITGIPIGADLSAGTDNGDGTWSLLPGDLSGLTLMPPADSSGVFDIGVSVTSTDGGVAMDTFTVSVNPVADKPMIAAADVTGSEDAAIALTLAASMPADTTETVQSITVTGVPDGAILSVGTDNGDGTWTLTPDQVSALTITPPTDYNGTFNLGVVAVSSDGGTASSNMDVTVTPLADIPQLGVSDAVGAEDGAIGLTLAASMPADTTEALYTITLEGVPEGATLSAGIDNGDGSWTLTPDLIPGLTLMPPQDFSGAFDLNVIAVSTDGGTAVDTMGVTVVPVADIPVIAVSDANGAEDTAIALTVAAAMASDTAEALDTIVVTGVPGGAVLSAGANNGDGSWTLVPGDLDGLTITPPVDYSGVFNLGFSVTSTDGGVASDTMAVNVGAVADIPVIAAGDVVGSEDTGIVLSIAANMPASTTETLDTITISGVPDGAVLSAGTDNGDGTWTLSADDLSGLTLTPPTDYNGTMGLNITAVSTDGGTATSSFNATVAPVADVPVLTISNVSGIEDVAVALDVSASMGSDTTETIDSVVIEGVPEGATLSAGVDNGDGTWTLTADQLEDLSIATADHYSGSIELSVNATSTDGGTTTSTMLVNVTPVADAPTLSVDLGEGVTTPAASTMTLENLGSSAGFDNTIGYYTLDENGEPSVGHIIWANVKQDVGDIFTLEGIDPDNVGIFLLSDGASENDGLFDGQSVVFAQDPNGKWQAYDVDGTQLNFDPRGGLFFAHEDFNTGGIDYVIDSDAPGNLNWEDLRGGGDKDFNDVNLNIDWSSSTETTTFDVYITAGLVDVDGSETLALTVAGVPLDAVLSAGTDNGDGTWSLMPDELDGLSLNVPGSVTQDFELSVTATATESDGSQASVSETVTVDVVDIPTISVDDVSGAEDNAIALNISALDAETVTIAGMPAGATLSAGVISGEGEWSISADELDGLMLIPPTNYSGTIQLDVTAVSSDGGVSTSVFSAVVTAVADAPILETSDAVVNIETPPGMEIEGTTGDDELFGTMGDDEIEGGSGDDIIYGDSMTPASDDDEKDDGDGHGHGHAHHHHHDHGYGHGGDDHGGGDDSGEAMVVALDINAALTDVDGSEALSIELSNVPDGAVFSVGTDNGDGTWTLLGDDLSHLDDLTMTLPEDTALDSFALGVTASSSELETGESASTTATIDVTFEGGVGGADIIDAGKGDDIVYGGGGDDQITGGKGDDVLYGEAGNDTLDGGKGDDVLVGGAGDDVLEGGKGEDSFVFHAGDGNDIVLDLSDQDILRFEGQEFNMEDFILQSDGQNETTTITFGEDTGVSVTLNDIEVSSDSGYTVSQDGDAVVVTFDRDSID